MAAPRDQTKATDGYRPPVTGFWHRHHPQARVEA